MTHTSFSLGFSRSRLSRFDHLFIAIAIKSYEYKFIEISKKPASFLTLKNRSHLLIFLCASRCSHAPSIIQNTKWMAMLCAKEHYQRQPPQCFIEPLLSPPHSADSPPGCGPVPLFDRAMAPFAGTCTGVGPGPAPFQFALPLSLPLHVLYSPPHEPNSLAILAAAAATSGTGGPGPVEPQPPLALFCSASQFPDSLSLQTQTLQSPFAYPANSAASRVLFAQQSVNETNAVFCEAPYFSVGDSSGQSTTCSSNAPQLYSSLSSGSSSNGSSSLQVSCTLTPPKSVDGERLDVYDVSQQQPQLSLQKPPAQTQADEATAPNKTLSLRRRIDAGAQKPPAFGGRRNAAHARRHAANMRERKRMHSINKAFDCMHIFTTVQNHTRRVIDTLLIINHLSMK